MRRTITILIIIVVVIGGFLLLRGLRQASAGQANYQTVTIERGDLVAVVGATGTVRSNQTTILTWQTLGRIGAIHVQAGDLVSSGEILAELDESTIAQNLILAKADLLNARRALETLRKSDTARAQAALALSQAQKGVEDAQRLVDAYPTNLQAAEASYIIAKNQLDTAQRAFDAVKDYAEDNLTRARALSNLTAAQLAHDQALANLNWLKGEPGRPGIYEVQLQLDLAVARLRDAQREWDRLKDGPNPDDIAAAEARVQALEASLSALHLDAPFTATVSEVRSKVGDEVAPGVVSFRLDDLTRLLVDVQITEVDINRVKVGQAARLTFDAVFGKEYNGKVVEVSRVGNVIGGLVNFTVTIELSDADENILPGMTAGVNIEVNKVENVLVVPNRAVRLLNGKRVIYILQDNTPTPVEVAIGVSSDTFSEVIDGGLKAGDIVVLNPPTDLLNAQPPFMR